MYTDLVVENSSFYEEYDCLKKSGAFKYIINEMGSEDVNEFIDLCDMVLNDMIKNVNSPEAFVRERSLEIFCLICYVLTLLTL